MEWKFNDIKEYVKFTEETYVHITLSKLDEKHWINDVGSAIIKNVSSKFEIDGISFTSNIYSQSRYMYNDIIANHKDNMRTRFSTREELKEFSRSEQQIWLKLFIGNDNKHFYDIDNYGEYEITVSVEFEKIENLIIYEDLENVEKSVDKKSFDDLIKVEFIKSNKC